MVALTLHLQANGRCSTPSGVNFLFILHCSWLASLPPLCHHSATTLPPPSNIPHFTSPPTIHAPHLIPHQVKTLKIHAYTILQVLMLVVMWVVKSSAASLAFPFMLVMMAPLRRFILPRFFTNAELDEVSFNFLSFIIYSFLLFLIFTFLFIFMHPLLLTPPLYFSSMETNLK